MKRFFTQPHTLFVFFALLFGLILVFLQPTGAGYDEETHMARIFEIATGHPIPNSFYGDAGLPDSFNRVSYRSEKFLSPVDWGKIQRSFEYTAHDPLHVGYRTRATYSPLIYLPQAVGMLVLGWVLDLPLPILYYLFRLSYLLSFTLMGYYAIRFIPVGKWVLLVLMLAPTTMLQASTITADAITFGVSFLFIAWALHLVMNEVRLERKPFLITLLLVFLLASVKINSIPLVLLLLFIKPVQFPTRKTATLFWVLSIAILIVVAGGWNLIAWQSDAVRRGLEGTGPAEVILNSLKNPLAFVANLFSYSAGNIPSVISSWTATYGYGYWTVPGIVFILFPIALFFGLVRDFGDIKIPSRLRAGLLFLFLLMFLGTFALRLILKQNMEGIVTTQGRYFVVVMPLLFIGLTAWGRSLQFSKWQEPISSSFLMLSLGFFLCGMGLSYYQLCGENIYTGKECIQPIYKNWGPSKNDMVQLTSNGIIQQSIIFDCNNVDMVKIQVLNLGNENTDGVFSFSLVNPENEESIVEKNFSMQEIPEYGFIQLDFSMLENVVNQDYFIRLQNLSSEDLQLGIPVSDPGEYRGPDSFSINGEIEDKDILFQYRCVK